MDGFTKTITLCVIPSRRTDAEKAIAELLGTPAYFYDFPAYGAMVCYHCNEDCQDVESEGPRFWCYGAWYRGRIFELAEIDASAHGTLRSRSDMMDEIDWGSQNALACGLASKAQ